MSVQEFLKDRTKVNSLVQLSDPLVRAVDGIVGEKVSMRVPSFSTSKTGFLSLSPSTIDRMYFLYIIPLQFEG